MSDRDTPMNDMEAMMVSEASEASEVSEVNETMSQQLPGTCSASGETAAEREDRDLVVAQGVFYRVLRPEEVPFWLREDAEQHMSLLSMLLDIPAEPIEWFVPALFDEVPEPFMRHVEEQVSGAPHNASGLLWSDVACVPRIVNPVYFWRGFEVLGFTMQDSAARGIFLRADMPRTGVDGLDYDIAHEMKHREQAHARAEGGDLWGHEGECERDADEFARWYMGSVLVGQAGLLLSPALAEAFGSELEGAEGKAPDADETPDETDAQSDVA